MPKIVIIEKNGTVKTLVVKDFSEATLYKKVGLKSGEGFLLQHTWGIDDGLDQSIKLYGKKNGRAGQENKYDFPPPVDETLFFGPCVLVGNGPVTGNVIDLTEDDWEEIYDYLFGGFEDVGSEDSDENEEMNTDDELETIKKTTGEVVKQTKQGYAKDGFIVDDEDEYEEEGDSESSDYTPPPKKSSKKKGNASATFTEKGHNESGVLMRSAEDSTTELRRHNDKSGAVNTILKSRPVNNAKAAQNAFVTTVQTETPLQIEECESELSEESYD